MTGTIALTDPLMTHSEPGRWWTSANTAEAMQGVLRPLDFTYQSHGIELGGRRAWHDFGVLPRRAVYLPSDPNDSFLGAFYGRIGINVNFSASLLDQVPGMSGADMEMALIGRVRPEADYSGAPTKRKPFIAWGRRRVTATQPRRLAEAETEIRAWWRAETARWTEAGAPVADGRAAFLAASARFDHAMYLHLRTRFMLIIAQSELAHALMAVEMVQHMQTLTAAVGTAESTVADDLWRVSRDQLTLDEFLARHGYHGPNEGTLSSRSWREDRRPLTVAVAALAALPDSESPSAKRARAAAQRDEVAREFEQRSADADTARKVVAFAQHVTQCTEQGKLLTLLAIDTGRAIARVWSRALVDEGTFDDVEDVHYLTVEEIRAGIPSNAREVVAFRRARRDEYLAYDIPLTWLQNPEPIPLVTATSTAAAGTTLDGIGCFAATYEGRARIVHDPAVDEFEAGDVLVCNTTDPSWLALMAGAGALVVDIGGPTSHGAIVAREFGLPCVMGTGSGTRDIRTGDLVCVDGAAGTVTILERLAILEGQARGLSMSLPGPHDDHLHERGPGASWQENYLFMAMDTGGRDATFVHVARLPALDTCDVKLAVVIDGTPCSFTAHHPIPDGLDVPGFHFEIVRPWYEWRVHAEGSGMIGGAPGLLITTGRGDVPISCDLHWQAVAPPVILSAGFERLEDSGAGSSGHHYVQGGTFTGTVRMGEQVRDISGYTIRDHTWGERHIVAMDHCWWTPMVFGDGTYQLGGIDMHTDDGTRTTFSFERDGETQVGFPLLDVEITEGDADDFVAVAIRCGEHVRLTGRRHLRLPIAYYHGGGTGWVSDDALCTLELEDGRTGFGIIERNRRLTTAEMDALPEGSIA